jgi:predicted nucleic acid-binding protein
VILVDTSVWVDHLLASATLSGGARLWTRDKRLRAAAQGLGLDFQPAAH